MLHGQVNLPFPESLRGEVRRWQSVWQSKYHEIQEARKRGQECKKAIPNNLLLALGACDSQSYPNVSRLLAIDNMCTAYHKCRSREVIFSTEETEDLFKIYHGRGDLSVITMHYKERVPVDEVCHAFVQNHPRRLFLPSLCERDINCTVIYLTSI